MNIPYEEAKQILKKTAVVMQLLNNIQQQWNNEEYYRKNMKNMKNLIFTIDGLLISFLYFNC